MSSAPSLTLIVIRLLPNPATDPTTFQGYLQDLTITAYDQNIISVDPKTNPNAPGTTEFELGVASGSVWLPPTLPNPPPPIPLPSVNLNPPATPGALPTFDAAIFQHFDYVSNSLTPNLRSVATAIIPVNITGLNTTNPLPPSPYPQYPSNTSYDVRLSMVRNGVLLPDPPMQWNVTTTSIGYPPSGFTKPIPILIKDIISTPSMYVLLQQPPPTNAAAASSINLSTDGTPPKFEDLVTAIAPILTTYNLAGASSLTSLTTPLTQSQCQIIAQKIAWNPSLTQFPNPIPPYPAPESDVGSFDNLYTAPNKDQDDYRKQFEGALASYQATNNATAQKLAPYVFAAAAAVYAEVQTVNAQTAGWTLPLFTGNGTTTTSATVTLSISTPSSNPPFVVPAAYFYALCYDYPGSSDADHRYQAVLTTTADSLYKKIQAAEAIGILNNSVTPTTLSGGTSVNDVSAVLRLSALSANYTPGSDPVLNLTGSVSTLVYGWLGMPPATITDQSPYWITGTPPVFDGKDYLNTIMQIVALGPGSVGPVQDPTPFINEIMATPLVPTAPGALTYQLISIASDLPKITQTAWLSLFTTLLASTTTKQTIPAWVQPGNAQQLTQAFVTWIKTLFTVGFQPATGAKANTGNVGSLGTDFSSNVLAQFFSEYSGLDLSVQLDATQVSNILSTPAFSDPSLHVWVKDAVTTINALCMMTKASGLSAALQFSYMEALYARGFTSNESVAALSSTQFQSALTGTVAYSAASAIYSKATNPPISIPNPPGPGSGFQSCNPGSLVNCIPPANLSPLGKIEYLHELLLLSSGTVTLGDVVATRRAQLGNLETTLANLETEVCVVDLVNESLEALGSQLTNTNGSVYDTATKSLADFDIGKGPNSLPADKALSAIPEYSSPASSIAQPKVYSALDVCFTSPSLPYSQVLDVRRSYLCHIGTTRFDTMRHFRQYITEFPGSSSQEPQDFEKEQWRLPVRFDVALEYLQISKDEYNTLWSATISTELILQLYGIDTQNEDTTIISLLTVSGYLAATGLTYCEFLELWKSGVVPFSPVNTTSRTQELLQEGTPLKYPECLPCCLEGWGIKFTNDDSESTSLTKLVIFIRLWRKLQLRCGKKVSFSLLADICSVLGLFGSGTTITINSDFLRQLASLLILVDLFNLPWTDTPTSSPTPGVERTKLLGIWTGPTVNPSAWDWAVKALLSGVEKHSQRVYHSRKSPEFSKILTKNLDQLSALAGFTKADTWFSNPTCTIRFAEILSKIYASNFTLGELIFIFTTEHHLDGDDPFQLDDRDESLDNPLHLPNDSPLDLHALRKKLISVEICDEEIQKWDWYRVESAIREAGLKPVEGKGTSDSLLNMAQYFFPDLLEEHGYQIEPHKRRFTTSLSPASTSASMWGSPPCEPFHYTYDLESQISNSQSKVEGSGQLWIQLPLRDDDVLKKLRAVRQLNSSEILAVQNLYFAPRVALAPFAMVFSNFGQAVQYLVTEPSEKARFEFFRTEVALFHRRCELIAEHLAEHVKSATCFDEEQKEGPDRELTWKILTSLIADENIAATPWENDSGLPPAQFASDPKFSGNAFAAILGLIGTGLEGQYITQSILKWLEMRGGMRVFGRSDDEWNAPVPTVIPALDFAPKSNEEDLITFKNGMILKDEDGKELGGAQPFTATWTGSLNIDQAGHYRFGCGHPNSEKQMPECCPESTWTVKLGRGQKTWVLLSNNTVGGAAPAHVSSPVLLHKGVYHLTVTFEQAVKMETDRLQNIHHIHTGFQLKYEGPDTCDCPVEVPYCSLLRDSKTGPFRLESEDTTRKSNSTLLTIGSTASKFLELQYISTFRDIRRTYQRAFKATLFAHRFDLSARKIHCDHQSELGYMLDAGDKFAGTSYYLPAGGSAFVSHHANFNFNFLPVLDPYLPPNSSSDSRADPLPQRQAAMFDWFERIFDYTQLRKHVEGVRKRPIWLLFHDVATQKPTVLDQYVRYIGIDINLSALALQYFQTPLYTVVASNLLDERWPIRLWRVLEWICTVSKCFRTHLLAKALPSLWASDDPSATIGNSIGNGNLTYFVLHSSLDSKKSPRLFRSIKQLNDGLRVRARDALLTYLCSMDRVALSFGGTQSFAKEPSDLSDLLLQDVQAKITEKSSRIDDGILSVQTFVQRARIGLEPSFTISGAFSKQWDDHFSCFDKWVAWKRRQIYGENWVQWEELQKLSNFEGPKFLKEELKQFTSTIAEPGRPMWWAGDNFPHSSAIAPIQVNELTTYSLEQGSTSTFEGLSLIGTPQRDARSTLLAAGLVFESATASSNNSNDVVSTKTTSQIVATAKGSSTTAASIKRSAITQRTAKVSKFVDATGIGTLEAIPLWVEAAIRLGAQFVRVAAAGVPPSFGYNKPGNSKEAACCTQCGMLHDDVVDEYYFWLQESQYFDYNDAPQNADVGAASAIDPNTDWEDVTDSTALPTLIYWPPKPLLHLNWTRVHMGRLDPPRRSDEGIPYDPTASAPLLTFTGRQIDSLTFTALTPVTSSTPGQGSGSTTTTFVQLYTGFRYDLATDTVTVTPQVVGDSLPNPADVSIPSPLSSFPTFAYFQPGKPLVPVSSYGVALAMASASRSNCQFESALKWCQLLFDPLSMDNTWPQCPKKNVEDASNPAVPSTESAVTTKVSSAGEKNTKDARTDSTKIPIGQASTASATKSTNAQLAKSTEANGSVARDLPCCPSSPVNNQITRARAVTLEFLKNLLHWGDHLLHRQSMEASHQALIIFNTMDRLLGPRPLNINAHDMGTSSMTVASFVASPAPLNPELLRLYDVVVDRRTMIREAEEYKRLHEGLNKIRLGMNNSSYSWIAQPSTLGCETGNCFSRYQPYRFTSLFPKAMDMVNMVKGLGSSLLSSYEKGDGEYLASIRSAQDRKILDLGLRTSQNTWRASDWEVQALDESMQGALTRLRYYQGLINAGLNSLETGYQFAEENAMQSQNASNVAEGTAEAANIIPDLAFGVAGLGPYQSTTIPIGQKLANASSSAARIMSMIAQISSSTAGLQLTQAGWARRSQDWQNQVNVIQYEIQQIKRQTLAAWRRRDSALHDLNAHQQQMDHAAEVQDFMRDKFTKHELYLFLQQETTALYRQAYTLAVQIAKDAQDAFKFERGDIERNFLYNLDWNNLHEGLMAGERLEMSLMSMESAYMETNCREYELTKNISTKLQFPEAFVKLKSCGVCEVDIPEWMFDLDYPGHYMRRIKAVSLTIGCVAGPYTSINCRLQLLNSAVRISPLLPAGEACCCNEKEDCCDHSKDPYVVRHYGATESIATSNGQDDSGLFQLDFKDERYLPFEYKGAESRWRIELPPENNQFDLSSLTDVVLRLNYTSREGGHQLRRKANECAQRHLPGNGIRFLDIRHDFPDAWRIFQMGDSKDKHRDWPLRFSRSMFPFLTQKRAVRVTAIHLFIQEAHACPGKQIRVHIFPAEKNRGCKDEEFFCVVGDECPCVYHGKVTVDFGPIFGNIRHNFGFIRFKDDMRWVEEAYMLCEYVVDCLDDDCGCIKCCAPNFGPV